jgi:hypothetical protein
MFKKFKNFVQKNIAIIITLIFILVFLSYFKIGSVKSIAESNSVKIVQVDSSNRVIVGKIENTTGENLFSLVNTIQKNTVELDSLKNTILLIVDNEEKMATVLKSIDRRMRENKTLINKIDGKLNGLQSK